MELEDRAAPPGTLSQPRISILCIHLFPQHLHDRFLSDILFVDGHHILVPIRSDPSGETSLVIINCYRETNSPRVLNEHIFTYASLVLQLPPLANGHIYHRICMYTSTDALRPTWPSFFTPFCVDPDRHLIELTCFIGSKYIDDEEQWSEYTLIVPVRTILSRLPRGDPLAPIAERYMLPWRAWGTDTRFMDTQPEDMYNSKYVTREQVRTADGAAQTVAVVYDFAPVPALLEDLRREQEGGGDVVCTVPKPGPVPDMIDADQLVPAVPCRRVVSNVVIGEDEDVRLYEDGLIVFSTESRMCAPLSSTSLKYVLTKDGLSNSARKYIRSSIPYQDTTSTDLTCRHPARIPYPIYTIRPARSPGLYFVRPPPCKTRMTLRVHKCWNVSNLK